MIRELGQQIHRHTKTFVQDVTREGSLYAVDHLQRNLCLDRLHKRTAYLVHEYAQREAGKPIDVTLPTSTHQSRLLRAYLPEVPSTPQDAVREVNVLTNEHTIDIRAVTHGNTHPLYMRISYSETGMRVSSGFVDEQSSHASGETKYLSPFAIEVHNGEVLINGISFSEIGSVSQIKTKAGRALKESIHPRVRQMLYIMNAAKSHVVNGKNPSVIMHFEAARFKLAEMLQLVTPDGTIHPDVSTNQHFPVVRRSEIPADEIDMQDTHTAVRTKIIVPHSVLEAGSLLSTSSFDSFFMDLHERDHDTDKIRVATEDLAIARWVAQTEKLLLQTQDETRVAQVLGQPLIASSTVYGLDRVLHPSFESPSTSSSARRRTPRITQPIWDDKSTKKLEEVA